MRFFVFLFTKYQFHNYKIQKTKLQEMSPVVSSVNASVFSHKISLFIYLKTKISQTGVLSPHWLIFLKLHQSIFFKLTFNYSEAN